MPLLILRRDRAPFAMAGLWDLWRDPDGQELRTFTILTTEANSVVRPLHDRMPVILSPEAEGPWLDPAQHDHQALAALIRPYPAELMAAYQVSPAVNSPAHEGPQLVVPAAAPLGEVKAEP
jgi:putative SOS response-associated peptidase YedK